MKERHGERRGRGGSINVGEWCRSGSSLGEIVRGRDGGGVVRRLRFARRCVWVETRIVCDEVVCTDSAMYAARALSVSGLLRQELKCGLLTRMTMGLRFLMRVEHESCKVEGVGPKRVLEIETWRRACKERSEWLKV